MPSALRKKSAALAAQGSVCFWKVRGGCEVAGARGVLGLLAWAWQLCASSC